MPSEENSSVVTEEIIAEHQVTLIVANLIGKFNIRGWPKEIVKLRLRRLFSEAIIESTLKQCDIEWPDDRINSCAKQAQTSAPTRPQLLSDTHE